jgi:phosphosulfolactate phosphohydrolase-like enzyme|tara:strand:- start:285 stop:551 length:267 start_codon:yes stop_codon:yes gene_type:complete
MKYALIKNNIIEQISYQKVDGWEEVEDTVFAKMIKKEDGTFDDSDEVKTQRQQAIQNWTDRENKRASAKQKLLDLGLTADEIKYAFNL